MKNERKRTPKIAVARTCTYTAAWRRHSRSTSALPGCGPAAVETMPLRMSASGAAGVRPCGGGDQAAEDEREQRGRAGERAPSQRLGQPPLGVPARERERL